MFAVFPLMLLVMITILMVQLQSFQRLFLVLATAPLATHRSCRGAADLGRADGVRRHPRHRLVGRHGDPQLGDPDRPDRDRDCQWQAALDAVIAATQHRLRPILLTAAAAILGMIPIAPDRFLGTDGLRGDGRTGCGNAAYAGVPARALCRLVPHCTAGRAARTVAGLGPAHSCRSLLEVWSRKQNRIPIPDATTQTFRSHGTRSRPLALRLRQETNGETPCSA